MKKQYQILTIISFTIINFLAFQNCGKQSGGIQLYQDSSVVSLETPTNIFNIDQNSEPKSFTLETIYPADKDKFRKFSLNTEELPIKTPHGMITDFDPKFGKFTYQPEKGFYGDDIIPYTEENIIDRLGVPTRTEANHGGNASTAGLREVTITLYPLKMIINVRPDILVEFGKSVLLTETPPINVKNPILSKEENSNFKFEAQVVAISTTGADKPLSEWTPLNNGGKITGLTLTADSSYKVVVRKINSPNYAEKIYFNTFTAAYQSVILNLGDTPDSLFETPAINVSNITNPQEDSKLTFDVQIYSMANNAKVIVKDPSGSDWFKGIANGSKIKGLNLKPQVIHFMEIANINSPNRPKKYPSDSWTPSLNPISTPNNLTVSSVALPGIQVLSQSPLLSWGPPELVNKVKSSSNLKFQVAIFDYNNLSKAPIFEGIATLNSDGTSSINAKFMNATSYAFKVKVVSVDAKGTVLKSETPYSVFSKPWNVRFQVNCQKEVNPLIGSNCFDGSIYLGLGSNRITRVYTLPTEKFEGKKNWKDANDFCNAINGNPKLSNSRGWHLPNKEEVAIIQNYTSQKARGDYFSVENYKKAGLEDRYMINPELELNHSHYWTTNKLTFARNNQYYITYSYTADESWHVNYYYDILGEKYLDATDERSENDYFCIRIE